MSCTAYIEIYHKDQLIEDNVFSIFNNFYNHNDYFNSKYSKILDKSIDQLKGEKLLNKFIDDDEYIILYYEEGTSNNYKTNNNFHLNINKSDKNIIKKILKRIDDDETLDDFFDDYMLFKYEICNFKNNI
jgi:hypothetical protein